MPAQTRLVEALQAREITREYEAVAIGTMTAGGTVEEPIARHSTKRTHMAVHPMGKPAVTHYRIMEHFRAHTRLRLRTKPAVLTRSAYTWLTSAIRWWAIRCTVAVHVRRKALRKPSSTRCAATAALHATMLRLYHPISGIQMEWHAPLPQDMVDLINALKADTEEFKDQMDW